MPTSAPPRVTARPNGWPVRRMPRWTLAAVAALIVAAVAVALVHKPSTAERASDMRGLLQQVTSDIESCAAGVGESLTALHEVQAEHFSNSSDISAGISVAQQGAANCAPANNEQIDDLENYQVPAVAGQLRADRRSHGTGGLGSSQCRAGASRRSPAAGRHDAASEEPGRGST